jgi:hypothetical protein
MPRKITKSVYQYDELSDKAKEKAREWFREVSQGDEWWDSTYDDAVEIAALFGLEISTRVEKWHVMGRDGKPGRDGQSVRTNIMFSGFSSQGDGACFEGDYSYKADALEAVKQYAPTDTRLHGIVEELQAAQACVGNRVKFSIRHTDNHYCHEHTMTMELSDDTTDENGEELPADELVTIEMAKPVEEALIRFANWIYRQLEKEYDYQNSDENVADNIRANEYEFESDGSRTRD